MLWVCSLRGQDSRWFGYIQSLPRETVDLSIFWGVEDVIDFSSSVCSSRGRTTPSQSAVGYVEPSGSPMELPGHTPSLQLLDGKQARMWLSCIETEKELDGLMVSFSSHCIRFFDMRFVLWSRNDSTFMHYFFFQLMCYRMRDFVR